MAYARASIGTDNYRTEIEVHGHRLIADEGPGLGGKNAGPGPYELLTSALAACTAITMRMYCERKQWPLQACQVNVQFVREGAASHINRTLAFAGPLDNEQKARLADIAERTPVTLTLKGGIEIRTNLA